MDCPRCATLRPTVEIRSPADLTKVILAAKASIRVRTLEEIPTNAQLSPRPFESLEDEGPWEDIVAHEFRCRACGTRFLLSVETYHGAGGEWSSRPPSAEPQD